MPATARAYGLSNPFDADRAIDARPPDSHLLREFGAVPLALAAYNAGPGPPFAPAAACWRSPDCAYVANIVGLLSRAGDPLGAGATGLKVRLVR
jgi:soluble lytic murein transglycosylase-like protein